ncbi:class I SAM-dependent methyltransferase [Clostridium estertheticum]|uniref:class I SAM-dependent methyltransferase n=1 Tax=Clostridium estertheticum TaxID=238834 RepID=UPI001C0B3DC5|nr:class I SAM-dependent methyltransferase [Clostridium estertheticum]MBU3175624.1 class I SAM-dependent methyltransferase [Clostridium estertheticum]
MENIDEVFKFYNAGAEKSRLERGLGVYSSWLSEMNNEVHLLELAPSAVEYAIRNQSKDNTFIAEVCDARNINRADESADIVLLMGPLYHLQNRDDWLQVLNEAKRVLKKDGLLFSVGISNFSSTTWELSTYGKDNNFLDDDIYNNMIENELSSGIHIRPKEYPYFIAQAYFHTALGLQNEVEAVGFKTIQKYAIEGVIWFTPCLNEKWKDKNSRERLLNIVRLTENEEEIIGMSPHFMIVSRK